MIEEFLNQLSKEEKSSFIEIEKNQYLFNLNEDIQIKITKIENKIYFLSKIAPIPIQKKEELFTFIMKINILDNLPNNFAIGSDDSEKFLTLSYNIDYEENYKIFRENIENFINYLLYLETEIKKFQKILFEKMY